MKTRNSAPESHVPCNRGRAAQGNTMRKLILASRSFLAAEDGPTAVEYAMMLMTVILACFLGVVALGTNTSNFFQRAANSIH